MQDYVPDESMEIQPVTPPRPTAPTPTPAPPIRNLDAFIPALATEPFVPLQALSEAELAMTVEEWNWFHMHLECDKFERDGEREVLGFERRAQEVQRMLEAL